jgi:hypothetical protein
MPRRPKCFIALAAFLTGLTILSTGNIPTAVGQPKPPAITPAPQAPTLTTPANLGARPGETVELTLTGTNLADAVSVLLGCPGKATIPTDNKNGTDPAKLRVKIELPTDCPLGLHTFRVATRNGVSNFRPFVVDDLPLVAEADNNRTRDTAQVISIPVVVAGRTDAEASDFYKLKVSAGQTLTFEVLARRTGSPLDPIVVLHDARTKRELVNLYADDTPGLESDCRLVHTFKEAGEYLVEVRDTTYRGGADFYYRLRIGEFPGATTAFPLAAQRGQTASIGFAGPGAGDIPPVSIKAPADPAVSVVYVAPKRPAGVSGWPLPVRLSDWPQSAEQEPNNEPAKANKLAVPGGVSARFDKPGDVDCFAISGKKGQKLLLSALTYQINSPAEVLIRVLDAKGTEMGRSSPAAANSQLEFTPTADGEYVIACEHLNYLAGPNEIYHLSVEPVTADFNLVLALDRCEAPAGGGASFMVTVNRLNGYAGPVDLSVVGDPALNGALTVPAGQTIAFLPVQIKAGTKAGAHSFHVQGKIKVGEQTLVRFGTLTDAVKATMGGIPNPPLELLDACAAGVIEKPAFALKFTADPAQVEKGKTGKLTIEAIREKDGDGDITVTPLYLPPNITAAPGKPIPKGKTSGELGLTVTAGAAPGPTPLVLRATTKVGGKDYAITPLPVALDVIEPKKAEAKKPEEKKKDEKKK